MVKQRIPWLDAARGFGITMVVAGHAFSGLYIHPALFKFHIPMFFMLSGMVFSSTPMRTLIYKRIRSLVVPYMVYLILLFAVDVILAHVEGRSTYLPLHPLATPIERMLYGGEALKGIYAIFWFPTVLFVVQVVANLLMVKLGKPAGWRWAALMFASLTFAYLVPHEPSPEAILVTAMALPLFIVGVVYAERDLAETLPGWAHIAIILIGITGWLVVAPMDMKYQKYGTPVATAMVAVAITHGLCLLARAVHRLPVVGAVFAELGRTSLVIMFLHLSFYYNLVRYMPEWAAFIISIGGSWLFAFAAKQTAVTKVLFLGQGGLPSHENVLSNDKAISALG